MSYCAKNSRGKSGGGAAALSGHQPDPEGLLVYPVDFGVGAAGGDGRSAVLYPAGPPVQGPPPQMARDMYRAQRRVDTLRNYLEEAESVQAGVWALLCVLSRWLNRYEAERAGGGHGRHGLASAGAGGAVRKIAPFPPAFLGVYWEKGGKLRCLIFGWIPSWRCAATGTTRGRRRS